VVSGREAVCINDGDERRQGLKKMPRPICALCSAEPHENLQKRRFFRIRWQLLPGRATGGNEGIMRKWAGEEGDDFCRENTQPACFSEKSLLAKANGDLDEGGTGRPAFAHPKK